MRRRFAIAVLLLAFIGEARAEDPPRYGVAVWNAKGEFIASKWPELSSFVLGSGEESLIPLEGLDPRHAEFTIAPGEFKVIPIGDVTVGGDRVYTPQRVFPGQEINVGSYEVKFFLNASDDPAGEDAATEAKAEEEAQPIDPVSSGELAADARKPEFANEQYRFCHDPEFGKDGTEGVDFCAIFDETSDQVCPEARKRCPGWKHARLMCAPIKEDGRPGDDRGERVDAREGVCPSGNAGDGKTGKSRIVRQEPREPLFPALPPVVGWIIIGAGIAAVLFWFLKSLKDAGWEKDEKANLETAVLTEAERNLQALPEARSNVLLKLAERALARGDNAEAALLVHLAMLRFLDDEGLARYHPSKTNGDYLRAIRRHKPLAALFRSAANQTERIRFGDGSSDPEQTARNIEEARRVLVRGTGELPIEAAAPTAFFFALALFQGACAEGEITDPAFHSRAPTGMSALPVLLREAGMKVLIGRSRFAEITPDIGVVVVRSSAASRARWPENVKIDSLLDRDLSVVLIDDLWQSRFFLPVTSSISHARGAVEVALTVPSPNVFCAWRLSSVQLALQNATIALPYGRRLLWDATARTSTATATAKELSMHPFLVYAGQPAIGVNPAGVAWAAERVEGGTSLGGCIYVFADRDLFTNASLTRDANARFAAAFFAALVRDGRSIMILDRMDALAFAARDEQGDEEREEEKPNPAKQLKSSNMLPFIAQGMVALAILFVMVGAAFGPLRDPVRYEHKAFSEHVEAIGRQYARTGVMGLTHSARSLARLVVMRYRDQVRGGPSGGWAAVAQHLAEKLSLEEKDVRAAFRLGIDGTSELGAPGPDDPTPSSERMLRTLSRLLGGKAAPEKKPVWRRKK